jgi:hypothetical protein
MQVSRERECRSQGIECAGRENAGLMWSVQRERMQVPREGVFIVQCALCRSQSKVSEPTKIIVRDLQVPREERTVSKGESSQRPKRELEFKITGKMV